MGYQRHGAVVSGILAAIAAPSVGSFVVTVAGPYNTPDTFGADIFGNGTRTPTSIRGVTIRSASSITGNYDFELQLSAELSQNYFRRLHVETGSGVRVLLTSDATYTSSVWTVWQWGDASNMVWDANDSGQDRRVTLVF